MKHRALRVWETARSLVSPVSFCREHELVYRCISGRQAALWGPQRSSERGKVLALSRHQQDTALPAHLGAKPCRHGAPRCNVSVSSERM